MAKQKTFTTEQQNEGRINARIIDAQTGLKVLNGVYAIRIHSKNFSALIMNDYVPSLGQVEGNITILNREGEHHYQGIRGFYKHQHNEFTLLLEERDTQSEVRK